jgi:molybdopterin synthase sulfur carrier subunit
MQRIVLLLNMAQNLTIALFGIARDIVGTNTLTLSTEPELNVETLLAQLKAAYPRLGEIRSLLVAVNSEYAEATQVLNSSDEIAIIPPVSGG